MNFEKCLEVSRLKKQQPFASVNKLNSTLSGRVLNIEPIANITVGVFHEHCKVCFIVTPVVSTRLLVSYNPPVLKKNFIFYKCFLFSKYIDK